MYYVRQFKGLTFIKDHNLIQAVSKYCKNIFSRNFNGSSIRNGTSSIQMHMFWTTIINLALSGINAQATFGRKCGSGSLWL